MTQIYPINHKKYIFVVEDSLMKDLYLVKGDRSIHQLIITFPYNNLKVDRKNCTIKFDHDLYSISNFGNLEYISTAQNLSVEYFNLRIENIFNSEESFYKSNVVELIWDRNLKDVLPTFKEILKAFNIDWDGINLSWAGSGLLCFKNDDQYIFDIYRDQIRKSFIPTYSAVLLEATHTQEIYFVETEQHFRIYIQNYVNFGELKDFKEYIIDKDDDSESVGYNSGFLIITTWRRMYILDTKMLDFPYLKHDFPEYRSQYSSSDNTKYYGDTSTYGNGYSY